MQTLLISSSTNWVCGGIAVFILCFGLSVIVWAIRTAECYEHEEDPVFADMVPVTYSEIEEAERPYAKEYMYS